MTLDLLRAGIHSNQLSNIDWGQFQPLLYINSAKTAQLDSEKFK